MLNSVLAWRRATRLRAALSHVKTWPGMRILDVGCGIDGRSFSDYADPSWKIVGIDLHDSVSHDHPGFQYQRANAEALPYKDGAFDLLVSFGMLEHILSPSFERVCQEMLRVARQHIVVVPHKWAWIEPHYHFPLFGALPRAAQHAAIRAFNLCGHRHELRYFDANYAWRTTAEYRQAFQGARTVLLPPTFETLAIVHKVGH